ncbi:MAG TPA: acetyl-CoA carboxylase biotin carboxyl carrier protein [Firmicutes bacterium]|nr:acetyl-CoA carboxylase biotin carboxyl carrier protein [Bacillota bacterium]
MENMELSMETVSNLVRLMQKAGLTQLKLKCDAFELDLEKKIEAAAPAAAAVSISHPDGAAAAAVATTTSAAAALDGNIVKAPIVGTFYASSAPGKPAFVKPGQQVSKGDVLFIIESMKLMNEIKSEYDGVIDQILVENGQSVEYGQPIMTVV